MLVSRQNEVDSRAFYSKDHRHSDWEWRCVRAVSDARRRRVLVKCWSHKRLPPETPLLSPAAAADRCCKALVFADRLHGGTVPRRLHGCRSVVELRARHAGIHAPVVVESQRTRWLPQNYRIVVTPMPVVGSQRVCTEEPGRARPARSGSDSADASWACSCSPNATTTAVPRYVAMR